MTHRNKIIKKPTVYVQPSSVENPETEWTLRRNEPGCEVVRMFSKRSNDYILKTCGRERARKTELLTRGKVTTVHYLFY